ncbi:MAG: hypothetical protein J7513_05675 [Solirubrobacteraceae bacterium]|nr:hypothetical protein [Solirubrobacteraceae bacterium]
MTGSGRYDRRPRRDWDDRGKPRSAGQQIGNLRLIGFIAILAVSFTLLNRKDDPPPTPNEPRIAADSAIAPTIRTLLPKARIRTGTSDELAGDIRGGLVVDLAVLRREQVAPLAGDEQCAEATPIAEKAKTVYAACRVNANGSSRDLANPALDALTSIKGRDALLDGGFDIPEVRPTAVPTTP